MATKYGAKKLGLCLGVGLGKIGDWSPRLSLDKIFQPNDQALRPNDTHPKHPEMNFQHQMEKYLA